MTPAPSRVAVPLLLAALLAAVITVLPIRSAAAAGPSLPPSDLASLQKLFDAKVAPLGLRVSRGTLQSLETYEPDPQGTHLALYVEPIGADYTNAQYLRSFTKLTHRFIPAVFSRWKGLESFDICQEPTGDPRTAPPPVTQIFVRRDALDRVGNWRKAGLAQLLAASSRVRSVSAGYFVYFAPELGSEPALEEASARAGWSSGVTAYGH